MAVDVFAFDKYRDVLMAEFSERRTRNPRYSLRSFARDLDVSAPRLCESLNGISVLSRRSAEKVGLGLGYSDQERDMFLSLVDSENPKSEKIRLEAKAKAATIRARVFCKKINEDSYHVVGEWHHFALLELLQTNDVKHDTNWLARALRLTRVQVESAIQRLIKLQMLEQHGSHYRVLTPNTETIPGQVPSKAIFKAHIQLMDIAKEALTTDPIDEREFHSSILAIDKKKMFAAKKAIRDFQKKFNEEFGASNTKDEVFCLATHFFKLARGERK